MCEYILDTAEEVWRMMGIVVQEGNTWKQKETPDTDMRRMALFLTASMKMNIIITNKLNIWKIVNNNNKE